MEDDIGIEILVLPVLGVGFCWSSIACSKNRFLSDTVFGVLADGGGVGDWNLSKKTTNREETKKLKSKTTQALKTNFGRRKEDRTEKDNRKNCFIKFELRTQKRREMWWRNAFSRLKDDVLPLHRGRRKRRLMSWVKSFGARCCSLKRQSQENF